MPETENKTVNRFSILNSIDVGDHIEKKNNLSYLSWAWAWQELKKVYPDSFYTIYENPEGWLYFTDGRTCWVKTGVTLVDGDYRLEHIEHLPVMDFKNQSISKEKITSMDVNKAIQRSLTKAAARHGIGLYIYAGEDLPEETEEAKAARKAAELELKQLLEAVDVEVKRITANFDGVKKVQFANQKIVPVIGQANYKTCSDSTKLAALLKSLKAA